MGMAEDIAQIRWTLDHMHNPVQIVQGLDEIKEKLKYDIEPKLDKALGGKEGVKSPADIEHMCWMIREIALEIKMNEEESAMKWCRKLTGCTEEQAKETVNFIRMHCIPKQKRKEAE